MAARRLYKQWHPDKAGNTEHANAMFRLVRRHVEEYTARGADMDDSWLDTAEPAPAKSTADHSQAYQSRPSQQSSWFDEFERDLRQERQRTAQARVVGKHSTTTGGFKVSFSPVTAACSGPPRFTDAAEGQSWLQQAELEVVAAQKLKLECAGGRALPAASVWHCSQAVEMSLKSAMLRTCGITTEELKGRPASDLPGLANSLRIAPCSTDCQRRAKEEMPGSHDSLVWLNKAYIKARYPNASLSSVPGHGYSDDDASFALGLAKEFIEWAKFVEDLAEPTRRQPTNQHSPFEGDEFGGGSRGFAPASGPEASTQQPHIPSAAALPSAATAGGSLSSTPKAPIAPPPPLHLFDPPSREDPRALQEECD